MKILRPVNIVLLFLVFIILIGSCQKKDETGAPAVDGQQTTAKTAVKMEFVGRQSCEKCHQKEYDLYLGSDHDMAMDMANDTTGIRPLQQYLVELPGGRYQCLPLCWDTRPKEKGGQRWFHIYGQERIPPNDMLFWTQVSQNWNYMCAECHSTHLKKNFDYRKEQYHTTWSEIDVSCEACHGPGSAHLEWAAATERGEKPDRFPNLGLAIRLKATDQGAWVSSNMETGTAQRTVARNSTTLIEMCARCHSRRSVISEDYIHGKPSWSSIPAATTASAFPGRIYPKESAFPTPAIDATAINPCNGLSMP